MLLFVSTLVGLCLAEAGLKLFMPRYADPARAVFVEDPTRLRKRQPDARIDMTHPDTGERHPVIHNSLGMRQHRPMSVEPSAGEVRVGLFGDSFTENVRLPAPYSLSEVLDFLLRQQSNNIAVLNFGVDGYGLDQSYLSYLHSPAAAYLEEVIYVFCANDIRNLYENQLLGLDSDGMLVNLDGRSIAWWVPLASRLALTYLVFDTGNWLRGRSIERVRSDALQQLHARKINRERSWDEVATRIQSDLNSGREMEETARYRKLAEVILRQWAGEATLREDNFRIMALPYARDSRMADNFGEHRVLNLYPELGVYGLSSTSWTFANDAHWNELGNLLAAVHLYRELASELSGTPMNDREIRRSVHAYYRAFGGWQPTIWTEAWDVPETELEAIRHRYLALE